MAENVDERRVSVALLVKQVEQLAGSVVGILVELGDVREQLEHLAELEHAELGHS